MEKQISQVFAVVKWPQVHPKREVMGKPVQVWCINSFEPFIENCFLPIENISHRVIISVDCLDEEEILIVIPLVH